MAQAFMATGGKGRQRPTKQYTPPAPTKKPKKA